MIHGHDQRYEGQRKDRETSFKAKISHVSWWIRYSGDVLHVDSIPFMSRRDNIFCFHNTSYSWGDRKSFSIRLGDRGVELCVAGVRCPPDHLITKNYLATLDGLIVLDGAARANGLQYN